MVEIGTKFKMPPSYTNKHVYEIVGETEDKHFWIVKNTSYPEYDDRGKGKWYSKWEVEEKIHFKDWIKIIKEEEFEWEEDNVEEYNWMDDNWEQEYE